ncbi:unnamed protein product, partial [Schistocephalus solidus]|uniref:ZU5 domain-containing protein n=1 Tax=Schistocephalus solidus TaxID=70667 RepID=A0A183SAL2_SCHSO
AQGRLRPRQPPATSPISGLLDSVFTPGSGGGAGESAVAATQGYYQLKLIHAQVTVPVPPGVEHTVDIVEIDGRTAPSASTIKLNNAGPSWVAAPVQLQLFQLSVDAENACSFQHLRVRDPVLPSQLKYYPEAAEVKVVELLYLFLVDRPHFRSIKQRRQ